MLRCNTKEWVNVSAKGTAAICMTAVDGKARSIEDFPGEDKEFVVEQVD